MKKVLMISRSQIPQDTRVSREARSLNSHGFKTSIFCIRRSLKTKRIDSIKNIDVERVLFFYKGPFAFWFNHLGFVFLAFIKTLKATIKKEFDIIHFHNPPDILYICAFLPKLFNIQIVFDFHDPSPEFFETKVSKNRFLKKLNLFFENRAIKISNKVIVTNETTKELFLGSHKLRREKIEVIRYGITKEEREVSKKIKTIKNKKKKIDYVFVGNMGSQDSILLLVSLAKYLQKNLNKDFVIKIIGDGDDFKKLKKKIENYNLNKYFKLYGHIASRFKVFKILKNSDIALEPAKINPLNNLVTFIKLIEYRFFKKPTICFDSYENRNTLGELGFYAKNNSDFFRKALDLASNIKSYGKLKNAKTYWENSEKKLIRLYETMLSEKNN
jgi:glycosyltransferase involved in cell wall biosynthesis